MIKKTITYKDYNDKEQTEDFYFNLSKGELVILEMSAVDQNTEGLADKIEKITKARNGREAAAVFKEIIALSYGVKSHDGARFNKSPELFAEFESTGAYSELVFKLILNSEVGSEFINGLMPAGLREEVRAEVAKTTQAAQSARERSAANMQGFKKAEPKTTAEIEKVPELPTVLETAAPVLEAEPASEIKTEAAVDPSNMSREELIAHFQNQKSDVK